MTLRICATPPPRPRGQASRPGAADKGWIGFWKSLQKIAASEAGGPEKAAKRRTGSWGAASAEAGGERGGEGVGGGSRLRPTLIQAWARSAVPRGRPRARWAGSWLALLRHAHPPARRSPWSPTLAPGIRPADRRPGRVGGLRKRTLADAAEAAPGAPDGPRAQAPFSFSQSFSKMPRLRFRFTLFFGFGRPKFVRTPTTMMTRTMRPR